MHSSPAFTLPGLSDGQSFSISVLRGTTGHYLIVVPLWGRRDGGVCSVSHVKRIDSYWPCLSHTLAFPATTTTTTAWTVMFVVDLGL